MILKFQYVYITVCSLYMYELLYTVVYVHYCMFIVHV